MATTIEFVVFALVGAFGVNAVPHFVKGVTGQRHMTPLGPESSALANVLWGSLNAFVAGALAWRYADAIESETLAIAFLTGTLMAVVLASYWGE